MLGVGIRGVDVAARNNVSLTNLMCRKCGLPDFQENPIYSIKRELDEIII